MSESRYISPFTFNSTERTQKEKSELSTDKLNGKSFRLDIFNLPFNHFVPPLPFSGCSSDLLCFLPTPLPLSLLFLNPLHLLALVGPEWKSEDENKGKGEFISDLW